MTELADALEKEIFSAGEIIVQQGESGSDLYIITDGQAKRLKIGLQVIQQSLGIGDYFCEKALITPHYTCDYTVMCNNQVTCLKLNRKAVNLILGPLVPPQTQLSKIKISSSQQKQCLENKPDPPLPKKTHEKIQHFTVKINSSAISQSKKNVIKTNFEKESQSQTSDGAQSQTKEWKIDTTIKLENLERKCLLGRGSYGKVTLVEDKMTGKTYALKAVSIQHTVRMSQKTNIQNERQAMLILNHQFLVKLYRTFHNECYLYFLLELCLGGELFSVLQKREGKPLVDKDANFYTGSVLIAFEYMHSKKIIYRDLKPENLLLDLDGYLKITDFGYAKQLEGGERTFTLCGTPDYLAPEVIRSIGHDEAVDWWCLGILTFEMLASNPPFYDENPMRCYERIKKLDFKCPKFFSEEAKDFVSKLLVKKPRERLGMSSSGANMIKQHKWFANFSFDDLLARKLTPPIIPKLKDSYDNSCFDTYEDQPLEDEDIPPFAGEKDWYTDF